MTKARITIQWSLLAVCILFLVTGFGISHFRTLEEFTGGLFTRVLAHRIHEAIWIPFIILLVLHINFSLVPRLRRKRRLSKVH